MRNDGADLKKMRGRSAPLVNMCAMIVLITRLRRPPTYCSTQGHAASEGSAILLHLDQCVLFLAALVSFLPTLHSEVVTK